MSGRSSPRPDRSRGALTFAIACAIVSGAPAVACGKSGGGDGSHRGEPLRVAAAADLALAFTEVGKAFAASSGKKVEFSFGSTGLLAKQIGEGAPYDVLAAANASYVDDVVRAGACLGETKALYARGRIVLWSSDPAKLPAGLEGLRDPKLVKIALANPEHAPYGLAAKQALTKSGLWASVEPRAVYGENVQQTMMFAQSGNADVAVVALSLAVTLPGAYVIIDPALHEPLDQQIVVCKGGSAGGKPNEARAFIAFVGSEPGRAIMRRYGFLLPGEALPSPQ